MSHKAKKPEQVAADLLDLSFTDIKGNYYKGLTESERALCTPAEFRALLKWVRANRSER